jgi:beta-barrel assembly-enhancing protease
MSRSSNLQKHGNGMIIASAPSLAPLTQGRDRPASPLHAQPPEARLNPIDLTTRPTARWRRALAALLAGLMTLPAAAQVRLPALGETASQDFSIADERRVGDQVMREGRRDPAYLDDPVLLEYLNSLWQPLLSAARQSGEIEPEIDRAFAWEAFLVRDRSVNAFAMPGGYVGMHLGLMALTTSSDQLASVLAHELSHLTQRHIARSIAPQQRASLLALAGLLVAVAMAGRSSNIDGANAAMMGSQAAALQSQLNFSRDLEREADRIGYGVLVAAGFSPAGMAAMFERMDQASRLNDNNGFPYLRSHPLTLDRVAEARNRMLVSGATAPPPRLLHAMMQMRARVLMDDSAQALQRLNGGTSSPLLADRVSALYGAGMAASLLREHGRAQAQAEEALALAQQHSPREPAAERVLHLLRAQVALAAGDAQAALQALNAAEDQSPRVQRSALLLRAQSLLLLHRQASSSAADAPGAADATAALRASAETLQIWLADAPKDPLAWALLADTSEALGMKLRSLRASAEARAAVGDLTGAVDRLRVAQQASRTAVGQDFIEGSVIDSRLRQILAQRRQLAQEAREQRGTRGGPDDTQPPQ